MGGSKRHVNAASLEASRESPPPHEFAYDFITDVVVYFVEPVEIDVRQPNGSYFERYFDRHIWFKIFLNINTGGHFGKYIATIESMGRVRTMDNARDGAHSHLMRQQMQARVLEAIVESGKDREQIAIGICPSGIRLERVDQCPCLVGDVFEHGIVASYVLGRLGLCAPDGEGVVIRNSPANRFDHGDDKVIQDRSEMVDRFVREHLRDISWLNYLKAVEVVRSIGIYLTAQGPWITRLEALEDAPLALALTISESHVGNARPKVLEGPVGFEPTTPGLNVTLWVPNC